MVAGARGATTRSASGRFLGLRPLLRKDSVEWIRGKRPWVVVSVTAIFMVLTAANGAITTYIRTHFPEPGTEGVPMPSLDPMMNLLSAPASQVFLMAAIFAVASLILHERESGTLAWVASKPVSRSSIWMSKWISSSIILAVAAAVIPFALTLGVVVALYGAVPVTAVAWVLIGMIAAVTFYAAVGLAAGAVLPSAPAIVAVGLGVLFLTPIIGAIVPGNITTYLPTSILDWTIGFAGGQDVGFATPIAWAIGTAALVVFATRRMERIEL
jgi:ABC-2 type transport system permease protein